MLNINNKHEILYKVNAEILLPCLEVAVCEIYFCTFILQVIVAVCEIYFGTFILQVINTSVLLINGFDIFTQLLIVMFFFNEM